MIKQEVVMTVGLPASGKSTWARTWIKTHPKWKRINKDDLRAMLDDSVWSKDNEKMVVETRDSLIMMFLQKGYNVIIDDTNFSETHKQRIQMLIDVHAKASGNTVNLTMKDFTDVPVQECIRRDKLREKPVSEKVILAMYNQYLRQRTAQAVQDTKKPRCVVFDIDGTIADHDGIRGHYDHAKYLDDRVVDHVAKHLGFYKSEGTTVIVLTARNQEGEAQTKAWLEKHKLPYDMLLMRKDDSLHDYEAKKEMLIDLMKTYFVEVCYEDRLRNVNMMRNDLGLNVFHVADGLF